MCCSRPRCLGLLPIFRAGGLHTSKSANAAIGPSPQQACSTSVSFRVTFISQKCMSHLLCARHEQLPWFRLISYQQPCSGCCFYGLFADEKTEAQKLFARHFTGGKCSGWVWPASKPRARLLGMGSCGRMIAKAVS